ncbi:Las1-like-domain-containing protein [Melampsora americana]|nr:Las1-like-domain-containing protein [Melampsora americana]
MNHSINFRRVPWSTPTEFLQVFESLFSTTNPDLINGLHHLHAWFLRAPSALPPAIQSTYTLLSLLTPSLETQQTGPQRRLALAMALTRFVNSMVDPLQTSMFARSIADLAKQLSLPLSLVQLRHRSTHEELPSETVLLDSARIAVDWLYTRYWYPTMNQMLSSSTQQTGPSISQDLMTDNIELEELRNLLKDYKRARKRELIDATQSLLSRQISQKLENWLDQHLTREFRNYTLEGTTEVDEEEEELERERRAIEIFVQELSSVGNLVPRAIKKRPSKLQARLAVGLRDLYLPLLMELHNKYPQTFLRALLDNLVGLLISLPQDHHFAPFSTPSKAEETYYLSYAAWIIELIPWVDRGSLEGLLKCLLLNPNRYCLSIVKMLSSTEDMIEGKEIEGVQNLLDVLQLALNQPPVDVSDPIQIKNELSQRFERWESVCGQSNRTGLSEEMEIETIQGDEEESEEVMRGWKWMGKNDWKSCPIGILPDGSLPQIHNLT